MAPADDDDAVGRKNRFRDDDEDGGEGSALGWGPKDLYFRLQNAIRQNRKKFTILAAAMLGAGLSCFAIWSVLLILEIRRPTIEMAIDALDFGAYGQARQFSTSVLKYAKETEIEKRSAALYVYGVATCEEVDRAWMADKTSFFRDAADALTESRELGFIHERTTDGYFYLGKSLFFSQNYPEAIENLQMALEKDSTRARAINWYLANAYFFAPEAENEKGLEALDRFEALTPILEREKQAAILLRVLLNLRMKHLEAAKESFATLSETLDPGAILYRDLAAGMICMQEAELFRKYAEGLEKTPQLSVPKGELEKLEKQLQETPLEKEPSPALPRPWPASPFLRQFEEDRQKRASVAGETNDMRDQIPAIEELRELNEKDESTQLPEPSAEQNSDPVIEPAKPETHLSSKDIAVNAWRRLADRKLGEAVMHFESVRRGDSELLELYRQAAFLEAMCLERLGEYDQAQEEYYSLTRTFPGTSEAIASQYRWGYIEHIIKHNPTDGLASLARFFEMLGQHKEYVNRWMTIADISNTGVDEIQKLMESKHYAEAAEILDYFYSIVPKEQLARIFSHLYSNWGEQLDSQAELEYFERREELTRQAREKFRKAGYWYEELARWTFAMPEYLNNLWAAAEHNRRGRNLVKALEIYRLYLDREIIQRQALAHYNIGEILLELNEIDAAVEELEHCIESYPHDPILEQARLALALALQEKREWKQAASLLEKNLYGEYAPDSDVYRDSLYELGRVYDRMGDRNAVIRLYEDVLQLYPDDPRTAEAHYMIALSNLNQEQELETQMNESPLKSQRDIARQTLAETRNLALSNLQQSRAILLKEEEENGLDLAEQRMLRNTYFMIGRLLTAMGEPYYDESIRENQTAVARYMSHPDVLQAYLQLARVYRLQGDSDQADKTMMQARTLFRRFQAVGAFQRETVYTERQWQELLATP